MHADAEQSDLSLSDVERVEPAGDAPFAQFDLRRVIDDRGTTAPADLTEGELLTLLAYLEEDEREGAELIMAEEGLDEVKYPEAALIAEELELSETGRNDLLMLLRSSKEGLASIIEYLRGRSGAAARRITTRRFVRKQRTGGFVSVMDDCVPVAPGLEAEVEE